MIPRFAFSSVSDCNIYLGLNYRCELNSDSYIVNLSVDYPNLFVCKMIIKPNSENINYSQLSNFKDKVIFIDNRFIFNTAVNNNYIEFGLGKDLLYKTSLSMISINGRSINDNIKSSFGNNVKLTAYTLPCKH